MWPDGSFGFPTSCSNNIFFCRDVMVRQNRSQRYFFFPARTRAQRALAAALILAMPAGEMRRLGAELALGVSLGLSPSRALSFGHAPACRGRHSTPWECLGSGAIGSRQIFQRRDRLVQPASLFFELLHNPIKICHGAEL